MKTRILLSVLLTIAVSLGFHNNAQATKHIITQINFTFSPSALTGVNVGDTIRWVWTSGFHTTTSASIPAGASSWDAMLNSGSQFFEYPVQVAGVFNYVCIYHASFGMIGSFTATGGGGGITLSGNVFDDANGLLGAPANTVDGTPTNAGGIFVNLVDNSNHVVSSKAVSAGGIYSFSATDGLQSNTLYHIILTIGFMQAGFPLSNATLPVNWVSAGENLGSGAGNDGLSNSILNVTMGTSAVSNANFGLDQLPSPIGLDPAVQPNPGGTNVIEIPALSFSGSDPESPSGFIAQIKIQTFPTNATSITINGTIYYTGSWPVIGVLVPTNTTGNPTQSISVDPLDGSVIVGINFSVLDNAGKESSSTAMVNVPLNNPVNVINGKLSYNNNISMGMPSSIITLTNNGTNEGILQVMTDFSGEFSFSGFPDGSYSLHATTALPWGGVNAIDALAILRHFVGISYLSGLKLAAANVDNNSFVNSLDALIVSKRFVGIINSFPVGDWKFQSPTVNVSGNNVYTVNFQGICTGDADGSYSTFSAKSAPSINLVQNETRSIRPGQLVTVPVKLTENTSVSAVSMILDMPANAATINNVTMAENLGSLTYNQLGDQLKISWFSLQPLMISAEQPLMFITFNASDNLAKGTAINLTLSGNSEMADADARPIENVTVEIPALIANPDIAIKHVITQTGFTFVPSNLTGVFPGDTVQWVWTSGSHTTTSAAIPANAATWDHVLTSVSTSYSYVPVLAGEYNYVCTYHVSMGMIGKFIVSSPAGINTPDLANNTFNIYPNPVADNSCQLTITSDKDKIVSLKIFNMLGAEISAEQFDLSPGINTRTLDLRGIKDGVYFVEIWSDNKKVDVRKLIKQ